MTAIFKIDQPGAAPPIPAGVWDRARRDIQSESVGGSVVFTAQDVSTTYLWELISEPPGSSVVLVGDTTAICSAPLEVTGGYLMRLTTNAGLGTEDVSVRYVGIPLQYSGLPIPATNEVDFDNSLDLTASTGTAEKIVEMLKWLETTVGASLFTGLGDIYVDITNGSNVTGTGLPSNPYQTLEFAVFSLAAPTNFAEFAAPCRFILAPGEYTQKVEIPARLKVEIIGDNFEISNDVTWEYDLDNWYGESASVNVNSLTITSMSSQKSKVSGNILSQNVGVASGGSINRTLTLDKVEVSGNIWNYASGDDDPAKRTGKLNLLVHNSLLSGGTLGSGACIGGQVENPTADSYPNYVSITAIDSQIMHNIYGCAEFGFCSSTFFYGDIDFSIEPTTSAGRYNGNIGGRSSAGDRSFTSCFFSLTIGSIVFGWDSAGYPSQVEPNPVGFDAVSYYSADGRALGGGRIVMYGWDNSGVTPLLSSDEQLYNAVFTVPAGSGNDSYNGQALRDTLSIANSYMMLSASNRAVVLIPPGTYSLGKTTALELDTNYVDLVAMNSMSSGLSDGGAIAGDTIIYGEIAGGVVQQTADDVRIIGVTIQQNKDDHFCLSILNATDSASCLYKNLTFTTNGGAGVHAVSISHTNHNATWIECNTDLPGFLQFVSGGDFGGKIMRCSGGSGSFAGNDDIAVDVNLSFSGYAEDCSAGTYSFAGTRGGGDATFDGDAVRCRVQGNGFGSSNGGTGPYTALCSGTFTDCDNYSTGGSGSFGYCEHGDATFQGTAQRCTSGNSSFGSSSDASGTGSFQGYAFDCHAARYSFGGNNADSAQASVNGELRRCSASRYSFGARGYNGSTMYDCHGTEYGCFGNTTSASGTRMERCRADGISTAGGPIGLFGATIIDCTLKSIIH